MLTLGRYIGQKTLIIVPPSETETVIVTEIVPSRGSGQTKTSYNAPRAVTILREELYQAKREQAKGAKVKA